VNLKTVSHRAAKPEMIGVSFRIGREFQDGFTSGGEAGDDWSEVSGSAVNFKTVSHRAAKPEMIGVKFQDRP